MSVRSAREAIAAYRGGVDWIDVKEPSAGPLGRAGVEVWRQITCWVAQRVPVSVALGEITERAFWPKPGDAAWRGLAARKVGLADTGIGVARAALGEMIAVWNDGIPWILVAYADWREAAAPQPEEVIGLAAGFGCAGVLLDTWRKGARVLETGMWSGWIERARGAGLVVGLAGGLDLKGVEAAAWLGPDIIGVRGAACAGGLREGEIETDRIRVLRDALGVAAGRAQGGKSSGVSSHGVVTPARTAR